MRDQQVFDGALRDSHSLSIDRGLNGMHQKGSCVLIPAVSGFARQRTVQVCILKHRAAVHVESISERGESGPFPTRILVSRLSIPVQWIQQTGFHSALSVGGTFFLRPLIGPFQTHPAFATTLRGVAITWSVTGKFLGVCRWWWFLGGPSPKVPKGSVHVFLYRSEDQKKKSAHDEEAAASMSPSCTVTRPSSLAKTAAR